MGLAMDLDGAQKLPGFVGEGLTKYLIMTGRSIDAERAYDAGLIEELHDVSTFGAELRALEDGLAGKPTYVHGLAKARLTRCGRRTSTRRCSRRSTTPSPPIRRRRPSDGSPISSRNDRD